MDYLAFSKMRTLFLRAFYREAARPFSEMRRRIEACEDPFGCPPGYEDAEPPFLSEWQDAGDALDVIGQSVASLASQTLKLYVEHWISELRRRAGDEQLTNVGVGLPSDPAYKQAFKRGWFAGYRAYCARLKVDWAKSAADLGILEQLILARNSAQHADDITSVRVRQTKADAVRFPNGFFADEFDVKWNENMTPGSRLVRPPRLDISNGKIALVLDQVDSFCSWLDTQHPMRVSPDNSSYG